LEVITEQVDQKRLKKMYDQPEADNETTISSLRALSEYYPDDVAMDLEQIEALWFRLGEQLMHIPANVNTSIPLMSG
jgi:hypothetical protein